ncbi:hypothetical protein [Gimesia sp.]|uniref:hypothetical protein n=1 Tax=Gimesia sp. TaxID=2024833 RepID=UPI000C5475D4|nr:hypothetical protein [Gimesia sp.]MAX38160.1 hypothetical protein [Gimesia sp.]HBL46818.1 hypothetical protein [Planctomycetaceae bacterium]|tara:strand:- start:68 stop:607 length:540 start_codon:yes stop_codon:yes gene_type:complete
MKHLILPSLILLVACTDTKITDQTDHVAPAKEQTTPELPASGSEGLIFGENPNAVVVGRELLREASDGESDRAEFLAMEDLASRDSWSPMRNVHQSDCLKEVETEAEWRDANEFLQDDGSDEYQVFQSLTIQLGTDQLRIRSMGPRGTKLRYEAESRNKNYEVEYDLKTVQIIKVITTN